MSTLSNLIDVITAGTDIHICITDVSGILNYPELTLSYKNKIHSKGFCDVAKGTKYGYNLCIKCKNLCNAKAIKRKEAFYGFCPYGIFECVNPVLIDGEVLCIVYVGNSVISGRESLNRLTKTCGYIGISPKIFDKYREECEKRYDKEHYFAISEIICNYISLLCTKNGLKKTDFKSGSAWVIDEIKEYVENKYYEHITVSDMSKRYFMNEKYLGRLFKKKCGQSFSEYINAIRLKHAAELLLSKDKSVIETALDCGYENVTYFNKLFREKYKVSPTEFRKKTRCLEKI